MKKIKTIIISIVAIIFITSCEKVIELDLKDAKQQVVVEGKIHSSTGDNSVLLTRSGSFFESNDFEKIIGANVSIDDNNGNLYTLTDMGDGLYKNELLNGEFLKEYSLNIEVDNKTYYSKSTMPSHVLIDSISYIPREGFAGPPGGGNNGTSFNVYVHFEDPVDETNYYRIRTRVNGNLIPDINIIDDALFNGITTRMPLRNREIFEGDQLEISLLSMDKANYEYFRLVALNGMGAMSTSIGNPVSNIEGEDVIGVFGAYATDVKTITIN